MKSSHRNALMIAAGLALLMALMVVPAWGQTVAGCPDGADCIDASDFNADLDGWAADGISAEWKDWVEILLSRAFGVAKIYNPTAEPGLHKSFYLQPGEYRIRARAAGDLTLFNNFSVKVSASDIGVEYAGAMSAWWWKNFEFGVFTVVNPEMVTLAISTDSTAAYFDYIYLEKMPSGYPTATPGYPTHTITPGGPTLTPAPSAVPVGNQATPVPPGTAVCQPAPGAGLPSYSITPTAAYTEGVSILESFSQDPNVQQVLPWSMIGSVTVAGGNDYTGTGSQAAFINYDDHWGLSTTEAFSNALVLRNNFGVEFWVNAWAQADVVPSGASARLEVWQQIGGTWYIVSSANVSAQLWYPVHAAISGSATHVAFVAVRSDIPTGGYMVLDDVYVYYPESRAPYCDGSYPEWTIGFIDETHYDETTLRYPSDKPCPGGIMQPNNLWGMLLAQTTLFLDQQTAMAPSHVLGTTRDLAQQFMLGPIGGIIMLATIIFDWQVPIIMLEAYLLFQAGLAVIGIWKTIRRAFIV